MTTTIALLDNDLLPPAPVGAVTDSDSRLNTVVEGAAVGATIGLQFLATDPNKADTVHYSLVADADGAFKI
jgi:hypothetical protein